MDLSQLYGKVVDGVMDQASVGNLFNVYLTEMGTQPTPVQLEAYTAPSDWALIRVIPANEKPPLGRYQFYTPKPVQSIDGEWILDFDVKSFDEQHIINMEKNVGGSVREERQRELTSSDWTQLPDSPLSAEKKAEWATYRQAWRDITDSPNWPQVERPTRPQR